MRARFELRPSAWTRWCPFCRDEIGAAPGWTCPGCHTEHHSECARQNGRCTLMGCGVRFLEPGASRIRPALVALWLGLAVTGAALAVARLGPREVAEESPARMFELRPPPLSAASRLDSVTSWKRIPRRCVFTIATQTTGEPSRVTHFTRRERFESVPGTVVVEEWEPAGEGLRLVELPDSEDRLEGWLGFVAEETSLTTSAGWSPARHFTGVKVVAGAVVLVDVWLAPPFAPVPLLEVERTPLATTTRILVGIER